MTETRTYDTAEHSAPAIRHLLSLGHEELKQFGEQLADQGFTAVRKFLDEARDYLRSFMDDDAAHAVQVMERLRIVLPDPGRISPAWQDIWSEFEHIIRYKLDVLRQIPPTERLGEWQVLLDNPYSNQSIAVYPALTFQEAVYLFAYFRAGLERSEFIRLQRVETVISYTGADGKTETDGEEGNSTGVK